MFHWLCPECGHEIAPGAAECPRCEPSQGDPEIESRSSEQTSEPAVELGPVRPAAPGNRNGRSPVDPAGIPENTVGSGAESDPSSAEPEWELVPAGNSDPAEQQSGTARVDAGANLNPVREPGADRRLGRRPRRTPPDRKRASEQNMPGLQATPPAWQQSWQQGAGQQAASGKKVWKAGVGYVDAAEIDSVAPGSNGLAKNLLASSGNAARRSPRAESPRPTRQPATPAVEPIAAEPMVELGRRRDPELGRTPLPGSVSEPGLASPVSLAPETPVRQPEPELRLHSRIPMPQPVPPAPVAPEPPAMDHPIESFVHGAPPVDSSEQPGHRRHAPGQGPQDMEALAAVLEGDAEPSARSTSDRVTPVRRRGELEPLDRLVAAVPIPTRPVDAPPGPLYGLASVAAHIPAPVTLLRQPEMRLSSGAGSIGSVCETLLKDPCLRAPEPRLGSVISASTLTAVAPYPTPDGIGAVLGKLTELRLLGGEPRQPESGPEVLRNVAHWLTRDLAPAPPAEHTGLVAEDEIPPSMGPVLPVELASLEGAGMSAVLQELSPSREEPKGSPKLNGMVMVVVTVVCLGLSALVFGTRGGSEPAPTPVEAPQQDFAATEVPPPPPAADEPAPPVEVTGFRLVPGAGGKAEIHYLVVNLNGDPIDPVTVNVTLLSDRVTIPVAEFAVKAPALGPYESREMVSPVEGLSDKIDMSVWRNLTAKVRLADPAAPAK